MFCIMSSFRTMVYQIWLVMGQRMTKCVFCVLCNFVFFFTMNTRIFSLNNCVFLYFLTPRCRRAKGNNFLLGLSFGKRVVRPKQHRGNPLCILRVFVFFSASKGQMNRVTPYVFCVFLCFFIRSEDTQPTSSMCFCVFVFFCL